MARRFAKVSEEEIEELFFYPSDLVNTKTTIPLRVGEERWIYTSTLRVSVYIHHYSPPLRGIVVYYFTQTKKTLGKSYCAQKFCSDVIIYSIRLYCSRNVSSWTNFLRHRLDMNFTILAKCGQDL